MISPEPRGRQRSRRRERHRFVVQKHDASRLHYDLRLEVADVLKSWAVPKGPSLDHRQKRLAITTEDHPLEYARFEGVIPTGQYGAGIVLVWDEGTYGDARKDWNGRLVPLEKCINQGHAEVPLKGKKIKGGYALRRLQKPAQWLLVRIA